MSSTQSTSDARFKVIRRNGKATHFDATKITVAITKAFLATEGGTGAASARVRQICEGLTEQVVQALTRRAPGGGTVHIEDIQDQVELALMRNGHQEVARRYVLYREERARARAAEQQTEAAPEAPTLNVTLPTGELRPLDKQRLATVIGEACTGLTEVDASHVLNATLKNLFDGVNEADVMQSAILSARALIETEPNYSYVTARLLLDTLRREVLGHDATHADMRDGLYAEAFSRYIHKGIEAELLDPRLAEFDLKRIGAALDADRDMRFTYLGLQTLYDRYFQHIEDKRIELPQAFWMRVSMGLALNEIDREARAIEFYNILSTFDFVSSTPTLFNSGTLRSQLSSCYLTTVSDDLDGIYSAIKDNALLSKYAGGLGNDWTRVRALGSRIKGTNGKSQGVVPFLKVASDTAVAVNQGGKRKGAVCAYLETWHLDIEEFIELRKNTGDDRRRTHDMNTANWIPDLFVQRVRENGEWTLFSPSDVPDLHDLYGKAFTERYEHYERKAADGELKLFKKVRALDLWRKMLSMLFETGHPWFTFKDPCNLRSPQQHIGVVHSSNLCTEITLNTSNEEIAVCNLGSVNLAAHVDSNGLDFAKLGRTVTTAMRMLDNVIDINYYSVPQARASNLRHRPVGLGIMAFQDSLFKMRIPYASAQAVEFADETMEAVSYHAIMASTQLAAERGTYPTYQGSLWSQGILPIDSLEIMAEHRAGWDGALVVDRTQRLNWDAVREAIAKNGMRNSNTMAIAPTATISNIAGVGQSIEPTYQNLYVKSNLSGEFTVINEHLVRDLKARGLWDPVMVNDLKYFDGRVAPIDRIPNDLKALYATAFEVEPQWLIECASRRQKWIDQAQSLNLYMAQPSGKKLSDMYMFAWEKGLKTTYYLRTLGATAAEKSTITDGALNAVGSGNHGGGRFAAANGTNGQHKNGNGKHEEAAPKACLIDDPTCEACQ